MPENNTTKREFMTPREEALKKRLIKLLIDDGKGHKHAKFAGKLRDFIIKIVPRKTDPNMTAAVDFENITIYISDGFLDNPDTFFQLNVLMRHELAHYLMKHQARMLAKFDKLYGKETGEHLKISMTFHSLMNIIEDFEISNTRYTEEDKTLVRNMVLGGEIISGLVTEDSRENWQNLSLEEMYDKLSEEIENLQNSIRAKWNLTDNLNLNTYGNIFDYITQNIKTLYIYTNIEGPTNFYGTLDDFIKGKTLYHFESQDQIINNTKQICVVKYSSLPDLWQDLIKKIAAECTADNGWTKQEINDWIKSIAASSPTQKVDLYESGQDGPRPGEIFATVYSPEEKEIAIDALKACRTQLELYKTWYDRVTRVLSDQSKYSKADLEKVLNEINK